MAGSLLRLFNSENSTQYYEEPFGDTYESFPNPATEFGWAVSGKTFASWNKNSDGSGASYSVGEAIPEGGTYYAIWEVAAVDYIANSTDLTSVANAIRSKGGTSAQLSFPTEFVSAIQAIQTGITPTGTKQITVIANGTTTEDVTNYANAQITVAIPVYNGEIIEPYTVAISLTNPNHASDFGSFTIYEMLDESTVGNAIGSIDSASGSTQVSVGADIYGIRAVLAGNGVWIRPSDITATGSISYVGDTTTPGTSGPLDFSVDSDGTISIDRIDWGF